MDVVEHLEKYIGKISRAKDVLDKKYNISISICDNLPFEGLKTYATLGLNNYFIGYYFEFVLVCGEKFNESEVVSFLTSFSEYLIDSKSTVLRGNVLIFDFPIISETEMNSLYFALPLYFNDDFQDLKSKDKNIIFPLIIPIYEEEALLIKEKGWNCFEDFLESSEVNNLFDFGRNRYNW